MGQPFKYISIFSLTTFTLGLSEFIVIGITGNLLREFNISISQVGLLVSTYALGISLGAPILTYITRRLSNKYLYIRLLSLFSLLNLFTVFIHSFSLLLILRILSGLIHGIFFSIASAEVPDLVEKEKASLALALMFSGLTIAMVIGIPLSIYIAENTNWLIPFIFISISSLICGILIKAFIPETTSSKRVYKANYPDQKKHFNIISLYAITFFGFGGGFYFYSYIEPWLSEIINLSLSAKAKIFIIIGFGSLFGNILGGILPQKITYKSSLIFIIFIQLISLICLSIIHSHIFIGLILFFWSVSLFSLAPIVQALSVTYKTNLSPRLSASLNVTAFNLGISFCSYVSTVNIKYFGLTKLPLGSAIFVMCALPLILFIFKKDNKYAI